MPDAMLEVRDLEIRYGGVPAVRGISLEVGKGEVVGLVGPNGAGKSSTLLAIMGMVAPHRGDVVLDGRSLVGRSTEAIVRGGVSLVPEGRRIFPELTVDENLRLGLMGRRSREGAEADVEQATALFPVVREARDRPAGVLSGGQQQQLAIARALVAKPDVLLLDEPSLGLAPRVVEDVFAALAEIRAQGVTILLVEQRAQFAVGFADRTHVLANGLLFIALEEKLLDTAYITARTTGFDAVRRAVLTYEPAYIERMTGVREAALRQTVRWLAGAKSAMVLTGRGPEQQSKGVDSVLGFINLMLALGKVGKPASGFGTLTGQDALHALHDPQEPSGRPSDARCGSTEPGGALHGRVEHQPADQSDERRPVQPLVGRTFQVRVERAQRPPVQDGAVEGHRDVRDQRGHPDARLEQVGRGERQAVHEGGERRPVGLAGTRPFQVIGSTVHGHLPRCSRPSGARTSADRPRSPRCARRSRTPGPQIGRAHV